LERRCLNLNKVRFLGDKKVYLFFNHDEALLCWYNEKKHSGIDNYFLITIDNHLDLTELDDETKEALKIFLDSDNNDIFTLREIIETKFRSTNSNFIFGAMELGIVNDALILSPDDSNLRREHYEDMRGIEHHIYYSSSIISLWYPKGSGILNNGYPKENRAIQERIKTSNLIVDIDLDYFTYYKDDKMHVLSLDNFDHIFRKTHYVSIYDLLERAKVITMALEPQFCGGIKNCSKILQLLANKYLNEFS